ncbi:cytochrome P450 [Brevibacillus parabrevis]|uniref:cytochrome P450 n=1 Tax=Brevibacillus parabrevis TaxID=54914 RepID=UPI001F60256D|nr:cytochrome P450 [Brevibacillus parabrevis]MDR5002752.1 cytochrome P450 [Brevibacillus parabrevis]
MEKQAYSPSEITDFQTKSEHFFPVAWYKKMLAEQPVFYHAGTNTWNVFRYEDVKRVLTDYALFSSVRQRTLVNVGAGTKEGSFPERLNIHDSDPPEHRKARSLFSAAFTPRSLKEWEPRVEQVVNELIREIEAKTEVDIVQDFTTPLPIIIMAELLGVPHQDKWLFKKWVDLLFMPIQKEKNEEVHQQKEQAAKEFFAYLHPFVVDKRTHLADDIISDLIQAEYEGDKLTDEDIVTITMFILGAGIETTSLLLANSFYSLLYDNPNLYAELRSDLDLVPLFVEEMLRYRFHISKMDRTVKEDNDVLGVELKKGDVVIAWMSAANFDQAVFEDPFALNIHRKNNNRHQSFSNGPHICLGAPLARMEANKAFHHFIKAFSRIEPVPGFDLEANLQPSAAGQALVRLPVRVWR